MAKFVYRMQSLLNIQYQLETQAKMELGRAQMRLTQEEEKLPLLRQDSNFRISGNWRLM